MRWSDLILTWRNMSGWSGRYLFMKGRVYGRKLLRWSGSGKMCGIWNVLILIRKGIMRCTKRDKGTMGWRNDQI